MPVFVLFYLVKVIDVKTFFDVFYSRLIFRPHRSTTYVDAAYC